MSWEVGFIDGLDVGHDSMVFGKVFGVVDWVEGLSNHDPMELSLDLSPKSTHARVDDSMRVIISIEDIVVSVGRQ